MYKPFPVYDLDSGLVLSREPWLIPSDAFSDIKNARIRRGIISKRGGYSELTRVGHTVLAESIGALGSTDYSGTLSNLPVRAGSAEFTDGTLTISDNGDGTLSGDGSGTINYTTGAYAVSFSGVTTGAVTANYVFFPGFPIMGIVEYVNTSGTVQTIFFDTKRAAAWNSTNKNTDDLVETDTWTGINNQFFWAESWAGRLFVTNGADRLKMYDGTTVSNLTVDIDDDAANELDTCLIVMAIKNRLVIFKTTEDGTLYPQRARWSAAGSYSDWTNDGYVDAPTNDRIVSAARLGDDVIVWFEQSIWALRYTGDADLPFVWESINPQWGTKSSFSLVAVNRVQMSLAPTRAISFDGTDVALLNQEDVPELTLNIDQSGLGYVYGGRMDLFNEVWWFYPEIDSSYSDSTLVYGMEGASWFKFDFGFSCMGVFSEEDDPTWDDLDLTWDEYERTWDERAAQGGYPLVLAGDQSGYIYKLEDGGQDNGSAIEFLAMTGDWNPFLKNGRMAVLGWVDFLVSADPINEVDVEFFIDRQSVPYKTETLTFDDTDGTGKDLVWKRIGCETVAESHRIRMSHIATDQTVKIHAVVPYFQPGGPII